MALQLRDRPSPNHDARPAGRRPDMLLLHYTGMTDAAAALDRLTDPAAKVSAHYLVEEDGRVWRLVPEDRRAWHAGVSFWAGERDINGASIGIELVNPGHEFGYRPFPEAQMAALEHLALDILSRQPIPPQRVLGHADVAPARKQDPGELFDWARLARAGIGLWPEPAAIVKAAMTPIGADLARFGYESDGEDGALTRAAIVAFQRHFRPARFDGVADADTRARLDWLLERLT